MKRKAGGDILRSGRKSGEREALSAVSATNTSMKRKPRESAKVYLLPSEIRPDAVSVHIDKRGRVHMVTYQREV